MPTVSSPGSLEVVGEFTGQFRCWRWQNVAFFCFTDTTTVAAAHELATLFSGLATAQAAKLSVINVVATRFSLPEPGVREVFSEALHAQSERLACVSLIVEGAGFWVSAVRSFATGLLVLSRRSFELHLDVHVDQLISWFPAAHQKHTGVSVDAAKLREHVDTVRGWHNGSAAGRAR